MFYILLIIPHVAAIGGLLWFAYRSGERENEGGTYGDDWDWRAYGPDAPLDPAPSAPALGPPLPDAQAPSRRRQPGEPLVGQGRRGARRRPLEPARDGEHEPAGG